MHACEIVAQALDVEDSDARQAFVESACGGDRALRERVLAMLEFQESDASFLGEDTFDHALFGDRTIESPGTVIGKYRLVKEIGEGGFGIVYLAEQSRPVQRQVALKIIKLGMDTRQFVARFEAERQTLALMDHPHIAQVHDAGATESGRPYFVMELVKGIAITDFCDQHRFTIRQRLELFVRICAAVQHAHQKGIIHRDLKPSNILVGLERETPTPKVIDFGVAKAIDQPSTETARFTRIGQLIGTPQYMSPEQAELSTHAIDVRSDIYTLGVVLFELLTGQPPVGQDRWKDANIDEVRQIILTADPPTPSQTVTTAGEHAKHVAQRRATQFRSLKQSLQGDLDWIVMKALAKDRELRYSSASALGDDLERHLRDEPVLAGPPSRIYYWKKFVKRHRPLVVSGVVIATSLLVVLVASAMAYFQTKAALDTAVAAQSDAETTVTLLENLIARSDPRRGKNADYRLSEALDDFARELPDLSDNPKVEIDVRLILGRAYRRLALNERAAQHWRRACKLQRQLYGNQDLRVADTLSHLAFTVLRDLPQMNRCSHEALAICEQLGDTSDTMIFAARARAWSLLKHDQPDHAERVLRRALKVTSRSGTTVNELRLPEDFVRIRLAQGRTDDALALVQRVIADNAQRGAAPDEFPWDLLALCYLQADDATSADRPLHEALGATRRAFGNYAFAENWLYRSQAEVLRKQWRHAEAAERLDTGRDGMNKAVLGWLLPHWAAAHFDLGNFSTVDTYCTELPRDLTRSDEDLYTRVVAHATRELALEFIAPERLQTVATANRKDFEEAKSRWGNDFAMHHLYAWNLLRALPQDPEALRNATQAATIAMQGVARMDQEFQKSFPGSLPYHVLARATAVAENYESAIELQRHALSCVPTEHLSLRGYFEEHLVDWLVAADRHREARDVLTKAVEDLEQAGLPPELQFHIARAELELAEYLLDHGTDVDKAEALRRMAKADSTLVPPSEATQHYRARLEELRKKWDAAQP